MSAHYEVRGPRSSPWKSGGNTGAEYGTACRHAARLSAEHPGARYEVRYRGAGELMRDVLLAAWQGGQEVPVPRGPGHGKSGPDA